jgi:hypothetical protein
VKIMFQVTQIVCFLLERGLRFRNLGFCGHDLMWTATFNAPQCTTVPIYPEGLAFSRRFLRAMVHLSMIRIMRSRSASEIWIAGLVGLRFLLDSGVHVSDAATEAPAARDVDNAAPMVTAEGRWAATWAGNLDAARA